jgi:hypothetical protein
MPCCQIGQPCPESRIGNQRAGQEHEIASFDVQPNDGNRSLNGLLHAAARTAVLELEFALSDSEMRLGWKVVVTVESAPW